MVISTIFDGISAHEGALERKADLRKLQDRTPPRPGVRDLQQSTA
jgi:hypothetical protein